MELMFDFCLSSEVEHQRKTFQTTTDRVLLRTLWFFPVFRYLTVDDRLTVVPTVSFEWSHLFNLCP